jgi:autophagy-related protein 2
MRVRLHNLDVAVLLYDGYDWARTRKTIEDQVKIMRRRLEKIRQLLASGQTHDPDVEETSALLFNSVYIGLEQNVEDMEPDALIAAIDNELDDDFETASRSSWQSLRPSSSRPSSKTKPRSGQSRVKHLTRSRNPCIEFRLMSANAEIDTYRPQDSLAGRTLVTIRDFEILDHIRTSTWKTFLTELRSDSRGNIRETESNMVRVELRNVKPVPGHSSVESRIRVGQFFYRLLKFLKFLLRQSSCPSGCTWTRMLLTF